MFISKILAGTALLGLAMSQGNYPLDSATVQCSRECPYADGQQFVTSACETFRIDCGKRHGTQVIYRDSQDSLEKCIEACGMLMACHSVDYDAHRKVCFYGKHQGAPNITASGFGSAYSMGCGCGCSSSRKSRTSGVNSGGTIPQPGINVPSQQNSSGNSNSNSQLQSKLVQELQDYADTMVAQGYPGLVAAVDVPQGKFSIKSGHGNLGYSTEPDINAHFRIGSFTKPFTAVVLLQLVGEGRLTLEDPVEKWLPGELNGNFDGNKITVRQLLQHTSGLPEFTDHLPLTTEQSFQQHRYDARTPSQLVQMVMNDPPRFPPGNGWSYSNTGFVLAGMIIDKVTGNSWRQEVRKRIIVPLGMSQTSVPAQAVDIPTPFITGYDAFPDGQGQQGQYIDVTEINPSCADAAGEIISTVEDGNKFLKGLISGKLLNPAQLQEMQATVDAPDLHPILPAARYGLGIMHVQSDCGSYWTHPGAIWGYRTRNAVSSDGTRSLVLVLNSEQYIQDPNAPAQGGPEVATRITNKVLCGT